MIKFGFLDVGDGAENRRIELAQRARSDSRSGQIGIRQSPSTDRDDIGSIIECGYRLLDIMQTAIGKDRRLGA